MGFRFGKRIKIANGAHLNLSKSGVGVSTGVKGFTVSSGPRGVTNTVSLPGTGMSFRNKLGGSSAGSTTIKEKVMCILFALGVMAALLVLAFIGFAVISLTLPETIEILVLIGAIVLVWKKPNIGLFWLKDKSKKKIGYAVYGGLILLILIVSAYAAMT